MGARFFLALIVTIFTFARRLSAASAADTTPVAVGGVSASSTILYIISLLFVFAAVVLSAYLVSKFIGNRFTRLGADGSLFYSLPLDHNKRIVFFELNGSILVLGVTEHSISLLQEISGVSQVENFKNNLPGKGKGGILSDQSGALHNWENKIKPMLRNLPGGKKGDSDK